MGIECAVDPVNSIRTFSQCSCRSVSCKKTSYSVDAATQSLNPEGLNPKAHGPPYQALTEPLPEKTLKEILKGTLHRHLIKGAIQGALMETELFMEPLNPKAPILRPLGPKTQLRQGFWAILSIRVKEPQKGPPLKRT